MIEIDQVYTHKRSGNYYKIVNITNLEADLTRLEDYPVIVVYKDIKTGHIWSRQLDNFSKDFSLFTEE